MAGLFTGPNDAALIREELNTLVNQNNSNMTVYKNTVNGYTKQQYAIEAPLVDAVSVAWNLDDAQAAYLLCTDAVGATRTIANPSNVKNGATYTLVIQQSSVGGNAVNFGSDFLFPGGTAFVVSSAANALDVLTFLAHGDKLLGAGQKAFS